MMPQYWDGDDYEIGDLIDAVKAVEDLGPKGPPLIPLEMVSRVEVAGGALEWAQLAQRTLVALRDWFRDNPEVPDRAEWINKLIALTGTGTQDGRREAVDPPERGK